MVIISCRIHGCIVFFSHSVPLKQKVKKSFWRDEQKDGTVLQIKDEGAAMDVDSTGLGPVSFSTLASRKVEEVGSANPVADFEALLARRDSTEWVGKAIQGMQKMIDRFFWSIVFFYRHLDISLNFVITRLCWYCPLLLKSLLRLSSDCLFANNIVRHKF